MKQARWQKDLLEKGELFIVGGTVRDEILGMEGPVDADYVVRGIAPEDFERILTRHGICRMVGKSFGVYKLVPAGSDDIIDIAFPRREKSTGTGHREFDVESDWKMTIEEDLLRRDFTINAMARNLKNDRIIDPSGGREDLKKKILRMVFSRAFDEDPLRILRGVRFAARLGLAIEKNTKEAMKSSVSLLSTLSMDRVGEEMGKLLEQCDRPSRGFVLLHEIGALDVVLPEIERTWGVEQNEFHPDDVFMHSVKSCDSAPRGNQAVRWAALMHDLGKVDKKKTVSDKKTGAARIVFYEHEQESVRLARGVMERMRCSKSMAENVESMIKHHMFDYTPEWKDSAVRRFIKKVGRKNLDNLFALRSADCKSRDLEDRLGFLDELKARVDMELKKQSAVTIKDLAAGGADVIAELGVGEGPLVGRILEGMLERVIEDPSMNTKRKLRGIMREIQKKIESQGN